MLFKAISQQLDTSQLKVIFKRRYTRNNYSFPLLIKYNSSLTQWRPRSRAVHSVNANFEATANQLRSWNERKVIVFKSNRHLLSPNSPLQWKCSQEPGAYINILEIFGGGEKCIDMIVTYLFKGTWLLEAEPVRQCELRASVILHATMLYAANE